jgi:hypothetical protein
MLKNILAGVAFAALFYATPVHSELKEMPLEGAITHPCGGAGLELRSITQYFQHRWQARHIDLDDSAVKTWVAYHKIEDKNITLVRVFQSYKQREMALVSATRFVNYLNGKPLVDLMCLVKMNGRLYLEYSAEELQAILAGNGSDI